VEEFAGEEEFWAEAAFHGFEVYFGKADAAAGDEFLLVDGLAGDVERGLEELLNQFMFGGARQIGPAAVARDAGGKDEFFPEARGEGRRRRVDQEFGGMRG